ncbi:MAG TPA: tetratricopeptide repeat protein [Blastocatellia bacterium]
MKRPGKEIINFLAIALLAVTCNACGVWHASSKEAATVPTATPLPADADSSQATIRFLEDKVKRDPEDFVAYNKLAGYYLQRLRETGSTDYLDLASRAAKASLAIVPQEMNAGALSATAQVELASHDFPSARAHAETLVRLESNKTYPYLILVDAFIELGDYDKATSIVSKAEQSLGGSVGLETRKAKLAALKGQTEAAVEMLSIAVSAALKDANPQRENVAWLRWQLGETAFLAGDYQSAEQHYRDSLTTFPDYYRALGGLGRALAAKGDIAAAIEQYERAIARVPDPVFVAALGDLYKLAGREKEAASQYALVEQIARLSKLSGALYNRQLALFYADHDMKTEEAYTLARKEYETRRDIYGADALAWSALKAGKVDEAQSAIKEALRLGTEDAKLFYHAGMIYRAAGDSRAAKDYLERALKLSPQFDSLQSTIARRALEEL